VSLIPGAGANDDWQGLNIVIVGASAALTLLIALAYISGGPKLLLANVGAAFLGLVYLVAAGWQTRESLRDAYHFSIILDDVLRSATGSLPYIDYLPTYTALLGTPLAIFPTRESAYLVQFAANWLLILQILSVLLLLVLVLLPARRAAFGVVLLAAIGPIAFVQAGSGQSALQSTPVIPGRVLLPLVGLLLLALAVRRSGDRGQTLGSPQSVALGAVFGLAVMNNLEFGGAASAAALLVIALLRSPPLAAAKRSWAFVAGLSLPLVAYAAYAFVFESRDVARSLLLIPLTYASAGFDLHPIESLGPFVLVVMLALTAIALGAFVLRSGGASRRWITSGVILTFAGAWSLISMLYFTGRSFTSVLIAGQSVQVALILGALTASLPEATRALRVFGASFSRVFGLALTLLPLFVSTSLLIGGGPPQRILAYGLSGQPVTTSFAAVENALQVVRADPNWRPGDDRFVGLIVENSTLAASKYRVRDATVMRPTFLTGTRTLTTFQCQAMDSYRFLILGPSIHEKMVDLNECREVLAGGQRIDTPSNGSDFIVYTFPSVG